MLLTFAGLLAKEYCLTSFNKPHLDEFLRTASPGSWEAEPEKLSGFAGKFSLGDPPPFGSETLTRDKLKIAAGKREDEVPSVWLMWAVLVWGGVRHAAIGNICGRKEELVEIISKIRSQQIKSRGDAYGAFLDLGKKGPFGLGPAFFTKLIFFAAPAHDGYIMDQWTAKSVNLIGGKQIVKLDGHWVSQRNRLSDYENFCLFVESLADKMRSSHCAANGEYVENCMFAGSARGRSRLPWRKYVRSHHP